MKKLFTLALAMLASVGLWATDYYTPTAEEVVEVAVTGPAIATHAAIGNAADTYTAESGKTCCDPSDVSKTKSQFALDLKDGNSKKTLVLNIAGCDSICLYCDRNDRGIKAVFTPSVGNAETIYGPIGNRYTGFKLDPNKSYSITFTGYGPNSKDATKLEGQDVRVAAVRLIPGETCEDPEAHLTFSKSTAFVGEQFSYNYGSKNGGAMNDSYTLNGATAVQGTDYTFSSGNFTVLNAGQFVMRRTIDAEDGYCAVDVSDTILINAANPVTEVTVSGPTAAYIGNKVTLTASADVAADTIWWTDQYGQKQDSKDGVFSFTPDAAGEYTYTAWAENQFNANPVTKAHTVTVTKLCGELIKVSATAYNAATATGIFSGTTSASMSSKDSEKSVYEDLTGYKLNTKNTHLGITFNAGQTLQAGDVATVFVTTVSAKLQLFADKGTTLIGETDNVVQGENQIILGSAANGANGIYVYRTEAAGADMNPFVAYISVTRSCEESDNNNASVTINGEAAEKSGTVFNYTLSASYAESTVAVEITLEHPLATLMEDHAASFTMATPEAGQKSVETFKVKAENGDQAWYSIFVEKAASLSSNADLSALSVAGLTLSPDFAADVTEYTVTKAYEAAMPAVGDVTATPADANAKGAEVTIAGNVITVTVTAENDDTKVYTITVNNAPALKSLSQVKFANGFDAFIDNTNHTVKAFYLAGDAAPEAAAIVAGNGTAGPLSEGKIVVTGADDSTVDYIVTLEAVTPNTDVVEETAAAGTFDGNEAWVKGGLHISDPTNGFTDGKYVLRRQLKSGDAANDQRVIAGLVRAYFFVGNASKLELTQTSNKGVKYAIDGGEAVEASGDVISIALEEGNHMIEIVTNQQKGNCELSAPKLVKRVATALDNAADEVKAVKRIENGQLFIEKNGVIYNAQGARLQ